MRAISNFPRFSDFNSQGFVFVLVRYQGHGHAAARAALTDTLQRAALKDMPLSRTRRSEGHAAARGECIYMTYGDVRTIWVGLFHYKI